MEKAENASNFVLFPQCFLSYQRQFSIFGSLVICRAFNMDHFKILFGGEKVNASAKSINPGQAAPSEQADLDGNFCANCEAACQELSGFMI